MKKGLKITLRVLVGVFIVFLILYAFIETIEIERYREVAISQYNEKMEMMSEHKATIEAYQDTIRTLRKK